MSISSVDDRTSLDISDEDDIVEPWENLLHYLTPIHIDKIKEIFANDEVSNEKYVRLSKEQFVDAIDHILGNRRYSLQALSLFKEIPYPDEEKITWCQFLDYYISKASPKDTIDFHLSEPDIITFQHIKRETIIKIVLLETDSTFCYAIISKHGKVGLYDGNFNFLASYNVIFSRSYKDVNVILRRKSVWITDGAFLSNIRILVISSSARSLTFYDASGQKHKALWLIEGTPNLIQCLIYNSHLEPKLFMGDESGSIIKMSFLQKTGGLFPNKYNNKLNVFYWREILKQTSHVAIDFYQKIHSSKIISMTYHEETYTIISCSRDKKNSVVLFNIKDRHNAYVFKVPQGAACFSINYKLHILITGNDLGLIQIWNIYVPNKVITNLAGHKSGIVDVKIFRYRKIAISASADGVLKLWNLTNYNCEQTLSLNYPCFKILGKLIEWGVSSIYPGPKRNTEINENKNEIKDIDSELQGTFSTHEKFEEDPWIRPTILISCCNYVGKITISDNFYIEYDKLPLLPAPPVQNDVIIPPNWQIGKLEEDLEQSNAVTDTESKIVETEDISEYLINIDYLKNMGLDWDINYKFALMESKLAKMRNAIEQCAPYIALDLIELDEVQLSPNLPVPDCRKTQQLAERTQRLLSAASTRSGILSDRSSKSRSSRSSIVEF